LVVPHRAALSPIQCSHTGASQKSTSDEGIGKNPAFDRDSFMDQNDQQYLDISPSHISSKRGARIGH
jgi:hypothetical protein